MGAVDPTCRLVLRCSAPGNCQEFGTSGRLSHLPLLCGLLILRKRMQSQTNSSCARHSYSLPLHPVSHRSIWSSLGGQPTRTSSLLWCLQSRCKAEHVEELAQGKGCWCGSQQCPFEAVFCGCIRIRTCQITWLLGSSSPSFNSIALLLRGEGGNGVLHDGSFYGISI